MIDLRFAVQNEGTNFVIILLLCDDMSGKISKPVDGLIDDNPRSPLRQFLSRTFVSPVTMTKKKGGNERNLLYVY